MAKSAKGAAEKRKQNRSRHENGDDCDASDHSDEPEPFRGFDMWRKVAAITEKVEAENAEVEAAKEKNASSTKPDDDFVQRYQERFVTAFAHELETLRASEELDAEAAERLVEVIHACAEAVPLAERRLWSPDASRVEDMDMGSAQVKSGSAEKKSTKKKRTSAATEEGSKTRTKPKHGSE